MADGTLEYVISGTITSNGVTHQIIGESYSIAIGAAMMRGIATALSAGEAAIELGAVASPVCMIIRNLDATNHIDVLAGSGGDVITRVEAGECSLVHLDPAVAPYILADTADCIYEYSIFDSVA